jgi:hypothetical protein
MKKQPLSLTPAPAPASTGPISPLQDMVRDWHRWSGAERFAAAGILAMLVAAIPLSLVAGILHSLT